MKKWFLLFALVILGSVGGAVVTIWFMPRATMGFSSDRAPIQLASFPEHIMEHPNFVAASALATPAVVHIMTKQGGVAGVIDEEVMDPFRDFFGRGFQIPRGPQQGSGSGVILSADGYIVTNHHVVKGADEIEVVLNDKRSFNATVVGSDQNTDIAVLKIEASELNTLSFGNSDGLQVGEWVLAVGNPFNLSSTVTAGIVSAKGRNINILGGGSSIEAFIQTDAAVNPGNSGGALVNVKGELMGINTAIASQTGSYEGYSFAIPANIAAKVVEDLKKYGTVQRGYLGVQIQDVDAALVSRENLKVNSGAYVAEHMENSAAKEAGIRKGDVIVEIDEVRVTATPLLMEAVSRKRPGESVRVLVDRQGERKTFTIVLRNAEGTTGLVKAVSEQVSVSALGATFESASRKELESLKIENGVKVKSLSSGKLSQAGIRAGFIITRVDKSPVGSPAELSRLLSQSRDGVLLEGYYPNGTKAYYGVGM
ncbi:MAG: Do family serine endopeptidase [Sphingomonadales bacterium]|nr:Do family serine endopeptidase [Sphingomonadales bacterium]